MEHYTNWQFDFKQGQIHSCKAMDSTLAQNLGKVGITD